VAREVQRPSWMHDLARRAQACFGVVVAMLFLGHLLAVWALRAGLKPYTTLGWVTELLLLGAAGLALGVVLVFTSERLSAPAPAPGGALVAAGALALLSLAAWLRYFSPGSALLSIAAPLDGLLVAQLSAPRWLRAALSVSFLLLLWASVALQVAASASRGLR